MLYPSLFKATNKKKTGKYDGCKKILIKNNISASYFTAIKL